MSVYVDAAHGGTGWKVRDANHLQEIGNIWRKCGVLSETDELKAILLRRPNKEIEKVSSPKDVLWTKKINPEKAREQHDNLSNVYKTLGIAVEYVMHDDANKYPNIFFVRDTFTMTSQGAIISRLASEVRSGEERIISSEISRLGMPIIASAHNNMFLEGPDIVLVNQDLVFLGVGLRTNIQAVQFVSYLLSLQGYSEIKIIQTTYGCGHLDGVLNLLNSKYAVIIPQRVSYEVYATLKRHGFSIVELSNKYEINTLMSINFVPINRETIIISQGAKETISLYKSCGVNCIEVDVSELMKGGGSVHCMTGVLWRKQT